MRQVKRVLAAMLAAAVIASPAMLAAQDRAQTLADIRQELTVLYVEIQRLKGELNTTGGAAVPSGASTLDRVNAIETQVQRLTNKTEELEFRINQVVKDGTNRIGDLEFRLVELEGGDLSALGQTTTLGGGALPDVPASTPAPETADPSGQLAVGEQADYNAARAAFDAGDYALAAQLFANFSETYPGGPMSGEALFLRGEALAQQGLVSEAARAYLASFSGSPDGARAPESLLKLGAALGELGQVTEACVTLAEVANRFPSSASVADAQRARQALGCP